MTRNFGTLLSVSLLFGLGAGIYEFALPYFLDAGGISVPRMGLIYAAGAIVVFLVRIYAGHLSDLFGRKLLYGSAVALTGIVAALTPTAAILWLQAILKSAFDAGAMIFDSMYQLCLHDDSRQSYLDRVGRTRGAQALAAAVGTLVAGLLLARDLYTGTFHLASAAFLMGVAVFAVGYRPSNNGPAGPRPRVSLAALVSFRLPRPLAVLAASGFIFTLGLSISHCFVMQLFWERQFGASRSDIGVILMLHRFTIALPLLLLSWSARRHLREIFMAFLTFEGIAISVSGLVGTLVPAAIIWLTHDLFGAGVWMPVQSALIQKYSREESRGRDVSQVFGVSALGWVFGPLIAGAVFERWYGGPFVLSGAIVILAAAVLLLLPRDDE